jgi:hypothetical protein
MSTNLLVAEAGVYTILALCLFVAVFAGYWKHEHATYPPQFAKWGRSFICDRGGTISER